MTPWHNLALVGHRFGNRFCVTLVGMPKKKTTSIAVELEKRLAETAARAARLKAATEKMESAVHELEDRVHEVEANAKQVHRKIRKEE